jgi:hypothetical protein
MLSKIHYVCIIACCLRKLYFHLLIYLLLVKVVNKYFGALNFFMVSFSGISHPSRLEKIKINICLCVRVMQRYNSSIEGNSLC